MCEEQAKPDQGEGEPQLICSGIWGGIRNRDQDISTGGLAAALYSSSCDGGKGGDIYFVGACKGCSLTRVAVADVVGHGQAVSDVSQYVYDSLKAHICDPDSGIILSEMNQLATRRGLDAMTTAVIVAYSGARSEAYLSYAGHPPVFLKRANEATWSVVGSDRQDNGSGGPGVDLPLAVDPDTVYRQQVTAVSPGDRLFIYTDGVTEAPNARGELFGAARLNAVLDANAQNSPSQLRTAVLQALHGHTGNGLTHDDVTLIAMRIG